MIKVLMRGRNCAKYIRSALVSIQEQTLTDWELLLVLDAPTDASAGLAFKIADGDNRMRVMKLDEHRGLAWNMYQGALDLNAKAEDIVVVVDTDDTVREDAFEKVKKKHDLGYLVTHGSYVKRSKGKRTRISGPYPKGAKVRKHAWRASHLKSFRYKAFEFLDESCFQHEQKWLKAASDLALMIPLIEVVGLDKVCFIKSEIYYWRDNTPHKTSSTAQKLCEKIIRKKTPLKRQF